MAILSDEKVASLTRRLVDTVIDYKKEAERLAIENETLRAALREIRDLNMTAFDAKGRQWANSDMIEQTIIAALGGGDE